MENSRDNERWTFIQLGLPAALIINRMRNLIAMRALVNVNEQEQKRCEHDPDSGSVDEEDLKKQLERVEKRLAAVKRWQGLVDED